MSRTITVDWGSWSYMEIGLVDINGFAINDTVTLTTNAYDMDGQSVAEISVEVIEDDTGDTDGDFYVYILRDTDGTNYETADDNPAFGTIITPDRNTTRRDSFHIRADEVSSFKVYCENDCGQQIELTLRIRYGIFTVQ